MSDLICTSNYSGLYKTALSEKLSLIHKTRHACNWTYLCKRYELGVASADLEDIFFKHNIRNTTTKQARIPPTILEVIITDNVLTGKDGFNISKTPRVTPTAIITSTKKFAKYKQTYGNKCNIMSFSTQTML